jgi:hypothetical protein
MTIPQDSGSLFEVADIEAMLRQEWWLHHGCPFHALYGDDGEMQCAACGADFKRQPLDELREHVFFIRVKNSWNARAE